ncbi:MAG TPA: hypothetical protein VNO20_10595 [Solirubrobacterales bacterium]|nr:hypothetical protein [Solirubrobacterales bacterium]
MLNSTTEGKAKLLFLGCVAKSHKSGDNLPGCEFKALGDISASVKVKPLIHNTQRFVLFEPLVGSEIANISFKPNLGCMLPLNNPLTGAVVAKVLGGNLDAVVQAIEFSEVEQLLIGDVLKWGALSQRAYLNATVDLEATGGVKLGMH